MTEYIRKLIARSNRVPDGTGVENMLMPRLPSIYEMPGDPGSLRQPGGAFGASVERTGDDSTDQLGRDDRSRPPFHAAPPARRERTEPTTPPRGLGTEAENQNRKHSGKKGASLYQIERDAREFRTLAQGIPMNKWESPNLEGILEVEGQPQRSILPRNSAAAIFGRKKVGEDERPDHPFADRYPLEPEGPALLPETIGLPVDRMNFPAVPGEPESWSGSPDIHIHIGRIEVRAVPTAAQQPPARPLVVAQPKLTLDEYLRRRNEGKR